MSAKITMNHDTLRRWLDAYGADARRWPADGRDAALALIAGDAQARAWFDDAATLDARLDDTAAAPPHDLRAAVLAAIPARPVARERVPLLTRWLRDLDEAVGGWRMATSALGLSAALGIVLALNADLGAGSGEPDLLDIAQVQALDLED